MEDPYYEPLAWFMILVKGLEYCISTIYVCIIEGLTLLLVFISDY